MNRDLKTHLLDTITGLVCVTVFMLALVAFVKVVSLFVGPDGILFSLMFVLVMFGGWCVGSALRMAREDRKIWTP